MLQSKHVLATMMLAFILQICGCGCGGDNCGYAPGPYPEPGPGPNPGPVVCYLYGLVEINSVPTCPQVGLIPLGVSVPAIAASVPIVRPPSGCACTKVPFGLTLPVAPCVLTFYSVVAYDDKNGNNQFDPDCEFLGQWQFIIVYDPQIYLWRAIDESGNVVCNDVTCAPPGFICIPTIVCSGDPEAGEALTRFRSVHPPVMRVK